MLHRLMLGDESTYYSYPSCHGGLTSRNEHGKFLVLDSML